MENVEDNGSIIKIIHGEFKKLPTKGSSTSFIPENSRKEGYLGILTNKSVAELEDLLARQRRIMENKAFTSKLKDGGLKIKSRCDDLKQALQEVKNKDTNEHGIIKNIDLLEWRASKEIDLNHETIENISEPDNTIDPLFLMATHSQQISAKPPCIKEEDSLIQICDELQELSTRDEISGGVNRTVVNEKVASSSENRTPQNYKSKMFYKLHSNSGLESKKDSFKTNRTSKGAIPTQPNIEVISSWEESSATGPTKSTSRKMVKFMSLKESYDLHYKLKLKEQEQLKQTTMISLSLARGTSLSYRDVNTTKHILQPGVDDKMFCGEK